MIFIFGFLINKHVLYLTRHQKIANAILQPVKIASPTGNFAFQTPVANVFEQLMICE